MILLLYLKYFILYSIIGFFYESFLFKISHVNKHSGILKGPYTLVYGIGGTLSTIIYNNLMLPNNIFKYVILYLCFLLTCTIIELVTGYLIKIIYKLDSWDYSYKKYHFGKYICLSYALIWGLMALFFVVCLNNFFLQITYLLSDKITVITLIIIIFDIIITYFSNKN